MSPSPDHLRIYRCPECRGSTGFDPTTVLTRGDDRLEALFRGELNRVTCEECGRQYRVETPIVYRDDEARYLVYFLPSSFFDTIDEALDNMEELTNRVFAELPADARPACRLVVERNQFVEKIALHQSGLDDRLIEFIKYMLLNNTADLDPQKHNLLFDFGSSTDEQIAFLALAADSGEAAYAIGFPMTDYEALNDDLLGSSERQAQLEALFQGPYVQVEGLLD